MFNRGRQDISEEELGKDIEALDPGLMEGSRHAEAGQRIIGAFFFVHAPEARSLSGQPQRAYEFLHATFGEYMVARRVMDELIDVAVKAFSGRRGLLSQTTTCCSRCSRTRSSPCGSRCSSSCRRFFADLDDKVRPAGFFRRLEVLVRTYRNRHGSDRYATYRPVPPDQIRQLACYSANLVALRVLLEPDSSGISLAKLLDVPGHAVLGEWKVTPLLWRSGLDTDGLRAMLTLLDVAGLPPRICVNEQDTNLMPFELSLARLIGDEAAEKRLRLVRQSTMK